MAEIVADECYSDDRRRVVNVGLRRSRDVLIAQMKTTAELGIKFAPAEPIAIRGERLVLTRVRWSGPDQRTEAFHTEVLSIVEINADAKGVAHIYFDPNDIDAAFEELDARYLAGEAAAYSHTWSVITATYAALNRREPPPTTPDWVNIDHRRGFSFAPGQMPALLSKWNLTTDLSCHIEVVHRLNDVGAVISSASHETSEDGVSAEWHVISVVTLDGDLINRTEIFDEGDLGVALARFDELQPQTRGPENAASRVVARVWGCLADRNWAALAEMLTDDFSSHDHRRVVNAGVRRGRDVHIANMRAAVDVGFENFTSIVIATRGRAPSPQSCPVLNPWPAAGRSQRRVAQRRRGRRQRPARRARCVRGRRYRRGLRGARRPLPRRRSGSVRTHVVCHCAGLCSRSIGTNCLRRRQTGSTSTIGGSGQSRQMH